MGNLLDKLKINHRPRSGALDLLKYIGPGLLVTVGFIDPGNWATNLAAGSEFGYALLWVVTFSSVMLIIIQHNVAHLGIVTGLCLSEATNRYLPRYVSRPILLSAMGASISTSLAEILGGAIALRMLFGMPIKVGAVIVTAACIGMLLTNTYSKIERWIILFVSIIGLSFLYELILVDVEWGAALTGWVKPTFPENSMLIIMSVLGAVVMPHNLFLHSEVIQSREWNLEEEPVIRKQLKYEFYDTLLSMVIGRVGPSPATACTVGGEQCGRHLCGRIAAGGDFVDDYFRHRRSFHLRRVLRGGVSSQGFAFQIGLPALIHSGVVDYFHRGRPVQRIALFANVAERAVAYHRLHTGLPNLQQKSDGQVCQLSLHHFVVAPVGHTGDGLERGVISQPVLTLCSYCE